ncbi:MAG: hypothetical protein AAF211_23165 [Myxococcota bacterium]
MSPPRIWAPPFVGLALLLTACGTLSSARPLEKGQTRVAATLGGPMIDFGGPLPLPFVVVEARHGLPRLADRPFDLGYGLNLTGLPFGLTAGHVGASWLLVEQNGARPALSLGNRVFFALNIPGGPDRPDPQLQGWGMDQIELTASWQTGRTLPYVSLAQYIDFSNPELLLTPAAGVQVDPGDPGGFVFQSELRWFGVTRTRDILIPTWVPGPSPLGIYLSAGIDFGGDR